MERVPASTEILVIGGGPAGSTAATMLARLGMKVTLLERARFPRYHIGESLLPTILPILDLLGAREKVEAFGFQKKPGAYLQWGKEQWSLDFGELSGNTTYAFQVTRSDFDQQLLEHARSQGVQVFEEVEVQEIAFEGERPRAATWASVVEGNGRRGATGRIEFEYLIDASGRAGIMATRYLNNRRFHKVFQNVAIWGYWEDADRLFTGREGDIVVESIPDGWFWAIPLHDGTMSVGVVMHKDTVVARRGGGTEVIYRRALEEAPKIKAIVERARLASPIYTEQDYSYAAASFCGPGYFLVGDSACFLDPLLSSGVHLATYSGILAAASINSIRRGEVGEAEAAGFFEKTYRQAYLRFLVFLSAFYDVGRTKESYFWEAQQLTEQDASSGDLKHAFLHLVTGVKDLVDVTKESAHHLVLEEMTRRIDENLSLRRDKVALASLEGDRRQAASANARFFTSVEGLFALNQEDAVDGLYVATQPYLRLARAQ
ncbi:MAG TPA: NAD(P)/FAD-dependent oxidoreductase [Anaerolineales bacterium]|nr:NAD(P)/FAD-dependent oxidoreductase [Anaerolineales bacterium]